MPKNRQSKFVLRGIAVVLIASSGYVSVTALNGSASPVNKEDPNSWVNSKTQRLDPALMPDRIRISVPWLKDWAWIDPRLVLPIEGSRGEGPFPVYASETGDDVVADYYEGSVIVPVGQQLDGVDSQDDGTSTD